MLSSSSRNIYRTSFANLHKLGWTCLSNTMWKPFEMSGGGFWVFFSLPVIFRVPSTVGSKLSQFMRSVKSKGQC